MSPSSLIFVAVVAIWATYLVVHVARYREYVATARTVDRFSSQMRVLERRAATYTPPTSARRVSSASLTRSRPLLAAPRPTPTGISDGAVEAPAAAATAVEAVPAVALSAAEVPSETQPRHRVRRAVLAASVLIALVTGVLAALSLVAWYVPVASLLLVAATLVGLRRAVVADRAAKRRRATAARRARTHAERLAREAAREARPSAPELPVALEYVEPAPQVEAERAAAELADAPTGSLAVPATQVLPAAKTIDPLHGDPAWDPTPVPPPTYTLKARAERPLPPPLDVPVPIEVESDDVYWSDEYGRPHAVNG